VALLKAACSGLLYFFYYLNDVYDLFADFSVSLKLYADDIKLYSHCDISSSCDLDSAIDQLYNWSNLGSYRLL